MTLFYIMWSLSIPLTPHLYTWSNVEHTWKWNNYIHKKNKFIFRYDTRCDVYSTQWSREANRPTFCKRHFQLIFCHTICCISIQISIKCVPKSPNNYKSPISHYCKQWWLAYWWMHALASLGLNELIESFRWTSVTHWVLLQGTNMISRVNQMNCK